MLGIFGGMFDTVSGSDENWKAEKSTEWVNERLLSIINTRIMKGLSTIYTSNCSLDDIGKRMGERIRSRIRGSVIEIHLTGSQSISYKEV